MESKNQVELPFGDKVLTQSEKEIVAKVLEFAGNHGISTEDIPKVLSDAEKLLKLAPRAKIARAVKKWRVGLARPD